MVQIPIILRLKKESHKKTAIAQDMLIEELYKIFERAVLHGGTAIWRCYKGNRFSEDVDVYIPKDMEKLNNLFENLEKIGFKIEKKKIGENSLYSTLNISRTIVKFEALFKRVKGSLKEYEKTDGNFKTIYTLTPEEIIAEKTEAYEKRLKVRDLYDIFFLLIYVENKTKIKPHLAKLIRNFKNPVDEQDLRILILEGITPKACEMVDYIKSFV